MSHPSRFLGDVYAWRDGGQWYYADSQETAAPGAELGHRYIVFDREEPTEIIEIARAGSGQFVRGAISVG
jgi:hypothetical protein